MFKALLAASLAMLACCVAAAWAGQVAPTGAYSSVTEATSHALDPLSPLPDADAGEGDHRPLLDDVIAEGFIPMSLAASYEGAAPAPPFPPRMSADEAALIDPTAKPAVIPLPPALYAGTALLAAAVVWRKKLLRACRA